MFVILSSQFEITQTMDLSLSHCVVGGSSALCCLGVCVVMLIAIGLVFVALARSSSSLTTDLTPLHSCTFDSFVSRLVMCI